MKFLVFFACTLCNYSHACMMCCIEKKDQMQNSEEQKLQIYTQNTQIEQSTADFNTPKSCSPIIDSKKLQLNINQLSDNTQAKQKIPLNTEKSNSIEQELSTEISDFKLENGDFIVSKENYFYIPSDKLLDNPY